jgi:hypothetical protein
MHRRFITTCVVLVLGVSGGTKAKTQVNNFDWLKYPTYGKATLGQCEVTWRISEDVTHGSKRNKWGTEPPSEDVKGETSFLFWGDTASGKATIDFNDEISGGNNGSDSWKQGGMDCNESHKLASSKNRMSVDGPGSCKAAIRFVWKVTSEVDLYANFVEAGNDVDKVEAQLKVSTWSDCVGAAPLVQHEISVSEATSRVISNGVNFTATIGASKKDGISGELGGGYSFSEARTPAQSFNITSSAGPRTLYCSYCVGVGETRSFQNWSEIDAWKLIVKGEEEATGIREAQQADVGIADCRATAILIRVEVYKDENGSVVPPGLRVLDECPEVSESTWHSIYKDLGLAQGARRAELRGGGDALVSVGATREVQVAFDNGAPWNTSVNVAINTVPPGVLTAPAAVLLAPNAETVPLPLTGLSLGRAVLQLEWTDPTSGLVGGITEPITVVDRRYQVDLQSLHSAHSRDSRFSAVVGDPVTVNVQSYMELSQAPDINVSTDRPDIEVSTPSLQAGGSGLIATFTLRASDTGIATVTVTVNGEPTQRTILFTPETLRLTLSTSPPMDSVIPEQIVHYVGNVANTGSEPLFSVKVVNGTPDNGRFVPDALSDITLVQDPNTMAEHLEAVISRIDAGGQFQFSYTVKVNGIADLTPDNELLSNQFSAEYYPAGAIQESEKLSYFSAYGETIGPHLLPIKATSYFRRGDADASGGLDITDAVYVLSYLFIGGAVPPCPAAADSDDNGSIEITDAVRVLNYLFLGGLAPPPPGAGACGPDGTPDDGLPICAYKNC